jgi:hypothetical protein
MQSALLLEHVLQRRSSRFEAKLHLVPTSSIRIMRMLGASFAGAPARRGTCGQFPGVSGLLCWRMAFAGTGAQIRSSTLSFAAATISRTAGHPEPNTPKKELFRPLRRFLRTLFLVALFRVRTFLLHLSKRHCHVFGLMPNFKAYVDRGMLCSRHRDTIAGPRVDFDDLLLFSSFSILRTSLA